MLTEGSSSSNQLFPELDCMTNPSASDEFAQLSKLIETSIQSSSSIAMRTSVDRWRSAQRRYQFRLRLAGDSQEEDDVSDFDHTNWTAQQCAEIIASLLNGCLLLQ